MVWWRVSSRKVLEVVARVGGGPISLRGQLSASGAMVAIADLTKLHQARGPR